jgi:hypothetical protein
MENFGEESTSKTFVANHIKYIILNLNKGPERKI